MEEVQSDVAALHTQAARRAARHRESDHRPAVGELDADEPDLPSLGVSGEIRVRPDRRPEFMADLKAALQHLFTEYGGAEGDAFKLAVACYPDRPHDEDDSSRQGEGRWPR
jgi:hypothetical protein